jgi:hypothetical protein
VASGNEVVSVYYNDGTATDNFALVVGGEVGDALNLAYISGGTWQFVNSVPRREKQDYGAAGGGVTYHIDL